MLALNLVYGLTTPKRSNINQIGDSQCEKCKDESKSEGLQYQFFLQFFIPLKIDEDDFNGQQAKHLSADKHLHLYLNKTDCNRKCGSFYQWH